MDEIILRANNIFKSYSNGEENLAIETYLKALDENPKQPSCLKNIGLIYEKRGRYAEQDLSLIHI